MPNVGDICRGRDLGKKGTQAIKKQIFAVCPSCSKTRWLVFRKENQSGKSRCQSCCCSELHNEGRLPHPKGNESPRWKGGRSDLPCRPYIYVRIYESDPFFCMATHAKNGGGEILEHRLIMARHLNRVLAPSEHIHHKNGDKKDNRIENLELVSPANHSLYDVMCSHCSTRSENRRLKAEIKRLTAQLPQLCSLPPE